MKIAVLFQGSSINKYAYWGNNKKTKSVNIKNNIEILNKFLLKKYDCDVFFHTWKNKDIPEKEYDDLVNLLNPIKYEIDPDIITTHEKLGDKVKTTRIKVIECFLNYKLTSNTNYDMIILTRFDIYFLNPLLLDKIEVEKNHIYLYDLTKDNINKKVIDKNNCLKKGIDDNFILFSPDDAIVDYLNAAKKKDNIITASKDEKCFYPLQHPSFHHIYYLLNNITILNLNVLWNQPYNNDSLYGLAQRINGKFKHRNDFLLKDNLYITKYK